MPEYVATSGRISPAKRLSAAVYDEIKTRILAGEYAPGEWLSVDELCRLFGVSRQPVMEAMRRLSGDWLVDIVPQVGCRIADYDQPAIVDFINTFGEMESHIAAFAAERRSGEQLVRLEELAAQLHQSRVLDAENRRISQEFHRTILEMADSAVLSRLCEQLWDFGWFWSTTLAPKHTKTEAAERWGANAERLAEAIAAKNAGAARRCMAVLLTASPAPLAGGPG
jgi:DNA-binding GntR family transcriptional regulator